MKEVEDSAYRKNYVEQLCQLGCPIYWIDETKYHVFVNEEEVNLYYIVEAAVSQVAALMRYLRRNVRTEDLLDIPPSEEWLQKLYDEWPICRGPSRTGRVSKKNAGEISLTILAEIFSWYYREIESLTIYTQDADTYKFMEKAEQKLRDNLQFTKHSVSPGKVAFKSNDFILCQLYRENILNLDEVQVERKDNRSLIYTRQQGDMSVILCKEPVTKDVFCELIRDLTVQILF